ncbi:Metallo-dependent hydrolase [Mycena venus]|uniref:Metallo-dependent hydrolase n=1 Tax=Mycena venus TaxID=2733690 RepID=A0A8H6YU48_9AGAR|nr:Metallo-dependent hydrolase [Mycena venus]
MPNAASSLVITNVRLAHPDPARINDLWRIECSEGHVSSVCLVGEDPDSVRAVPNGDRPDDIDAKGGLLLPSDRLCHAHIHLDKGFILDRCELVTGYVVSNAPNNLHHPASCSDFAEALQVTNKAKALFDRDDLYRRGYKLIRDSVECGVTSMRAHVEIDATVEFSCLEVGLKLSKDFRDVCDIQLTAFAQDPLFDAAESTEPSHNYNLLAQAAETHDIQVVGSAPYVEPTLEQAKANITLVLKLAQKQGCHVDFHLDYNLDPASEPLIYEVISEAKKLSWSRESRITIGHATRLQLFTPAQWCDLVVAIGELPIVFVGLPQSDIYMLGRQETDAPLGPPRSTLRIPYIMNKYNLEIAMSVNNVQNAFTPQGSVDPLSLCTFGVALFQSATPKDLRALVRSVTLISKRAIGQKDVHQDLCITTDDPADFVILHDSPDLRSAALNPSYDRTTIRAGIVVARRQTSRWFADVTT